MRLSGTSGQRECLSYYPHYTKRDRNDFCGKCIIFTYRRPKGYAESHPINPYDEA